MATPLEQLTRDIVLLRNSIAARDWTTATEVEDRLKTAVIRLGHQQADALRPFLAEVPAGPWIAQRAPHSPEWWHVFHPARGPIGGWPSELEARAVANGLNTVLAP